MRADMAKVIVERPRWGGGARFPRPNCGEFSRQNSIAQEIRREGIRRPWMRAGRLKGLNENLAPLRRFLASNVGRPWNKVHSEICQHMNLNSAVQLHIWQHLKMYVCLNAIKNGREWIDARGRPLWEPFLVDPKSGLLRRNESRRRHRRPKKEETGSPNFLAGDVSRCYRKIDGIWYEFELSPLPSEFEGKVDLALKKKLSQISRYELIQFHGGPVYATKKRQLNSKEIRRLMPIA